MMKNLLKKSFIVLFLFVSVNFYAQESLVKSVGIMSYLLPPNLEQELFEFDPLLAKAKDVGINTLSADIWVWHLLKEEGSVYLDERGDLRINEQLINNYLLDYYFHKAQKFELKLDIIISYHKLGGNVGDLGSVDMPVWAIKLFSKFALKEICNGKEEIDKKICSILPSKNNEKYFPEEWLFPEGVYKNNNHFEQNRLTKHNYHYISPWLTKYFLGYYSEVAKYFSDYINKNGADLVNKVIISVGSSGELKFQSYNETRAYKEANIFRKFTGIFKGDLNCHYPNFGEPQFYGEIPLIFYREWLKEFYKNDFINLRNLWEDTSSYKGSFDEIEFPKTDLFLSKDAPKITPELAGLYTFLNETLKEHLSDMLNIHFKYLKKTRLVIKFPGVFWGPKGEYFTLQGLTGHLDLKDYLNKIQKSYLPCMIDNYDFKKSYRDSIKSYLAIIKQYSNVELSYTAAEKLDGDGGDENNIPQTFFNIILDEALDAGVLVNIENALEWNLPNKELMDNFKANFYKEGVQDATLLRIQALKDEKVIENINNLINK